MFGIDSLLGFASTIIDKVFPSADEAAKAKARLMEMNHEEVMACLNADLQIAMGQIEVNKEEAKSDSLFKSGWRPAVGWVCVAAFAYHYLLQPLLIFILAACGVPLALPVFPMEALLTVLLGLLGLGGLRSFEKVKGLNK